MKYYERLIQIDEEIPKLIRLQEHIRDGSRHTRAMGISSSIYVYIDVKVDHNLESISWSDKDSYKVVAGVLLDVIEEKIEELKIEKRRLKGGFFKRLFA